MEIYKPISTKYCEKVSIPPAICLSNFEPNTLLLAFENIPNQDSVSSEENVGHDSLTLNALSKPPLMNGTRLSFDIIILQLILLL